jgi:energy-coupling factor transporter transmembrane protein EcfT
VVNIFSKRNRVRVLILLFLIDLLITYLAIYTALFFAFITPLIFINLYVILALKKIKNVFISQLLITLLLLWFFSSLINLFYFYKDLYNTQDKGYATELTPSSHTLLREYSRKFPEGFKLKDQSIRYTLFLKFPNKQSINIYDVTYNILNRQRVSKIDQQNKDICPRFYFNR